MISYVDTSTLLKLIIDEDGSEPAVTIWRSADALASVNLVIVEARAALTAAERDRRLTQEQLGAAVEDLGMLVGALHIVTPTDELVAFAAQLAELERLRGYDAVHLAAALTIEATVFSSADTALCSAAARRGLHVANPLAS